MIWFLIAGVIVIVTGVLCWKNKISNLAFFIGLLFSSSVALVVTVLIGELLLDEHLVYEKESEWDIVALQDSLMVQDRTYFLGRGYIETDLNYYYVYNTANGMKVGHIPATECYINYSDDNAHIEKCKPKWDNNKYLWITFSPDSFRFISSYYKIYIPEGSIAQDYNVNLR